MDPLITTIINVGLLVFAAAAAVAALVQAKVATDAKRDAEAAKADVQRLATEQTEALKQSAAELKRANDMREAETKPDDWRTAQISDSKFSTVNTSERSIIVDGLEVRPVEAERKIMVTEQVVGVTFEYGEGFDWYHSATMGPQPKMLVVRYHFEGESGSIDDQHENRIVI